LCIAAWWRTRRIGSTNCLRVDIGFSIGNDARLSGHSDTGMIAA
jgi:hypothetical protein